MKKVMAHKYNGACQIRNPDILYILQANLLWKLKKMSLCNLAAFQSGYV